MKKIIFIIPLLFLVGMSFGQKAFAKEYTVDTLSTSSSLDTSIVTVLGTYDYDGIIGLYVRADSLSGGTTATISYQGMKEGGTIWHTFDTDTINGAGTTYYKHEGQSYFEKYRIYIVAPSSTQSTALHATSSYKRDR